MKTKSKLVLGLSILGAATMAAGATSTFAWFQIQAGVSGSSAEQTLNVTKNSLGDQTMKVAATQPGAVHFTDADGAALVINKNGALVPDVSVTTDSQKESSFTVTLNASGEGQLNANVLKQLSGTYTLKVGGSKVDNNETPNDSSDDTIVYDSASRAKIATASGSAKTATVNYVDLTVTISPTTGLIQIGEGEASLSPSVTLYAAVDGGDKTPGTITNDGDSFAVTVAAWLA